MDPMREALEAALIAVVEELEAERLRRALVEQRALEAERLLERMRTGLQMWNGGALFLSDPRLADEIAAAVGFR